MKIIKKISNMILAILLMACSVPIVPQASEALFTDSPLIGREDFVWGVSMHNPSINNCAYPANDLIDQIHLAAEMGSKLIRIDYNKNKSYVEDAVTLCNAYGIKVMLIVNIDGMTITEERTEDELKQITESFKHIGEYFSDSKGLAVDYIQIGNEIDCQLLSAKYGIEASAHSGAVKENYEEAHINVVVSQLNAAIAGLKEANTAAQSVINFTWTHYGMIDWLEEKNVNYDIVGHGIYGEPKTLSDTVYADISSKISNITSKPIIIVEANIRHTQQTIETEENDSLAQTYDSLINIMSQVYEINNVKGFIFYELVDQSDKETSGFNREAHFGLIKYDNQNQLAVKPIYNRIKYIIGGHTLNKLTGPVAKYQYNIYKIFDEIYLKETKNLTISGDYRILTADKYIDSTRFDNAVDLTEADYMEFDLYLSEEIKTFNMYPGVDGPMLNGEPGSFYDWPNRCAATLGTMPAGWNHVAVKISDLKYPESNWDPTKMTGFAFTAFNGEGVEIPVFDIRVANFALTREIPLAEYTYENNIYEYEEGKLSCKGGLLIEGTSKASGAWGGTWLFNDINIYMNATEAEFLEFDMWVSADTGEFLIWMSNYISQINPGRKSYKISGLKGGQWNHISIDLDLYSQHVGAFAPEKFNSIYFEGSPDPAQVQFKVANIGLTKFAPAPAYENHLIKMYEEIDLDYIFQTNKDGNIFGNLYWSSAFASNIYMNSTQFRDTVNFNNGEYIEFDIYFSQKPENDFIMYASNRGWALNPPRAKIDIMVEQLEKGWNHIILPISDFYDIDEGTYTANGVDYTFDWSCIKGISLDGRPLTDMSGGLRLAITNFALTATDYAKEEMIYLNDVLSYYDGYDNIAVGAGENLDTLNPIGLNVITDLSAINYIEMNLFIESKSDITLHISSASSLDEISPEFNAAINLNNINFGWNQLHIPVSDIFNNETGTWSYGEFFDGSAVRYIYFEGQPSADSTVDFTVEGLAFTTEIGYEIEEGDFNTDGNVNIKDLIYIKKYIVNSENSFFANKAEITGISKNGLINTEDLIELKKLLLQ